MKYKVIRTDTADAGIRKIFLYVARNFGNTVALEKLDEIEVVNVFTGGWYKDHPPFLVNVFLCQKMPPVAKIRLEPKKFHWIQIDLQYDCQQIWIFVKKL